MLEFYFRNGQQVNGEWVYESRPCIQEFSDKIPGGVVLEAILLGIVNYVIKLLCDIGINKRNSGSCTLTNELPSLLKIPDKLWMITPLHLKSLLLFRYKVEVSPAYEKRMSNGLLDITCLSDEA